MEARLSWLIEFSPTLAGTKDAVKDEKSPNSCEDDTNSSDSVEFSDYSESSDSDDSSSDSSFEVMFVPKERAPTGKLGMKEAMGEDCFQVGGGGS